MTATNKTLIINVLVKYIKSHPALYKSFNFSRKQQKHTLNDYLDDICMF